MTEWNAFLQKSNFHLAWHRINTSSNIYYKKYFRSQFLAYQIALEDNLEDLIHRLKKQSYTPEEAEKVFFPKASGLQRPITLLSIEDQIVWQALVNIIARKWASKRKPFENSIVFSNIPNKNEYFFFEHYKPCYNRFKNEIFKCFNSGLDWVAHFDLASFYDSISHDLIIRMINSKNLSSEAAQLTKTILSKWSSNAGSKSFSHGIPQGPLASAYIGEVVFFEIDKEMAKHRASFVYKRYVDDIRLMSRDEDDVRRGVVILEQLCRNKGLFPQSKKSALFKATSEEIALGKDISFSKDTEDEISSKKSFELCTDGDQIINSAKFKYFLYHSQPIHDLHDIVFGLFKKYPEYCDAFQIYFERCVGNQRVISDLADLLLSRKFAYEYYEGTIWLILSEIDSSGSSLKKLKIFCHNKLLDKAFPKYSFNLRYGLMKYLERYFGRFKKRIFNRYYFEKSSILQGLLLSSIPADSNKAAYENLIYRCLIRTAPDAGIVAAMQIALNGILFDQTKITTDRLKPTVRNTLIKLNLHRPDKIKVADPFEEIMARRFKLDCRGWNTLLGSEYEHAHRLLVISEKAYDINPSAWICTMDSLNNIIVRSIINSDPSIVAKLVGKNGKLVPYGNLIHNDSPLIRKHASIGRCLQHVHRRRCSVPEAHPYDEKTATRSRPLKYGERARYMSVLQKAYTDINAIAQKQKTGA